MKNLQPNETELIGEWTFIDGKILGNEACNRIEYLINHILQKVGTDESGWDVLYRDPNDRRYWELTYPQSHMHGGGPPVLKRLSEEEAKAKYRQEMGEARDR
jgi:hypothetical protein